MFEDQTIEIDVTRLTDGLFVVHLPLPVRMEPVNCYVGLDDDGRATIIDAGLAYGAVAAWGDALAQIGLAAHDVDRIVVTHFHPDHIGGAGQLATLCDAPVWVSRITAEQSPPVWGQGLELRFAEINEHLLDHGMPAERVAELESETISARAAVSLPNRFELLEEGDELHFDGANWQVVLTPGHADGHLCLHDERGRRLLAGDHLLERVSPAVGLFPHNSLNPLQGYLASLERTAALAIDLVLPGHGAPFSGAAARSRELLEHHDERLCACIAALAGGPLSGHEVSLEVFGPQRDAANERFALTETLAHLELARSLGSVVRTPAAARPGWHYSAA